MPDLSPEQRIDNMQMAGTNLKKEVSVLKSEVARLTKANAEIPAMQEANRELRRKLNAMIEAQKSLREDLDTMTNRAENACRALQNQKIEPRAVYATRRAHNIKEILAKAKIMFPPMPGPSEHCVVTGWGEEPGPMEILAEEDSR